MGFILEQPRNNLGWESHDVLMLLAMKKVWLNFHVRAPLLLLLQLMMEAARLDSGGGGNLRQCVILAKRGRRRMKVSEEKNLTYRNLKGGAPHGHVDISHEPCRCQLQFVMAVERSSC